MGQVWGEISPQLFADWVPLQSSGYGDSGWSGGSGITEISDDVDCLTLISFIGRVNKRTGWTDRGAIVSSEYEIRLINS